MGATRRQFVQGAGVAGATLATAGTVDAQEGANSNGGGGSASGGVNVREFGAAGDGSSDDTQAIRRAARAAAPGGTVYFPPGTYLVGSNDRIPLRYPTDGSWNSLTWTGAGADEVTIQMAGGFGAREAHFVFQLRGNVGNARFEALTIDGNKPEQHPDAVGHCLLSEASGKLTLRDVRLRRANSGAMKMKDAVNADIQFCHFADNGRLSNGGHAISPNQTTPSRTFVAWSQFTGQGGVDVDTGHMTPGAAWQTVVIERSVFEESKRGVLKISSENKRTTVRNSQMLRSGEIPVKMNPTRQDIGMIELDNVLIDGGGWPAIDLPCPGSLKLNEVAMKNVNTSGQRGGGIYATDQRITGGRISIHNVNGGASPALAIGGCSGSLSRLVYGGVSGVGNDGGVVQTATRGAPLSPDVASKGEVGPRNGEGGAPSDSGAAPARPGWKAGPVDISFERTVDAVDDVGLDPNGEQLVDGALANVDSGTLVEFPTGRYLIDSAQVTASNVGLVAADGASPVFVPARPLAQTTNTALNIQSQDVVVSGFEFDYTREGYGGTLTVFAEQGDFYVGDVRFRGAMGNGAEGLSVAATDPDGTGVVERFVARDGSTFDSASHGLFVGLPHAGVLYLRDCEVWNWTDNGVYASSPGFEGRYRGTTNADRGNGEVHVQGGVFKNNNISNIRIGTSNSSVKGAVIHTKPDISGDAWDSRRYDIMPRSGAEANPVVNSRGIWLAGRDGLLVEDCDIKMNLGPSGGAIVANSAVTSATIRNTRIQVNIDVPALAADAGGGPIRVEGGAFTGSSSAPAIRVSGRAESSVNGTCLRMRNSPGVVGIPSGRVDLSGGQCAAPDLSASGNQRWGARQRAAREQYVEQYMTVIYTAVATVAVVFFGVFLFGYLAYRLIT